MILKKNLVLVAIWEEWTEFSNHFVSNNKKTNTFCTKIEEFARKFFDQDKTELITLEIHKMSLD